MSNANQYNMRVVYKRPEHGASVYTVYFKSVQHGHNWLTNKLKPRWRLLKVEYRG